MPKLRILMAAPEVAPFARTGGLGDVLGSLPKAFAKRGHELKIFLPRYGSIHRSFQASELSWQIPIKVGDITEAMSLEMIRDNRTRIEFYFVRSRKYFDRPEFYLDSKTGKDFEDNDERFIFFNRAVIEGIKKLGWKPDIAHVHDWQAALIPAYLKTAYANDTFFKNTKTVLTIHNLGYQGLFPGKRFDLLALPREMFFAMSGAFEFFGKVNFLKGGICSADKITTVSPRYAKEIQSGDEFGCGLEGVLQGRARDLTGILNGVDYTVWSPTRDSKIPYRYGMNNLSGKRKNKVELLGYAGLPVRESAPLIGMITRLTAQKGLDLLEAAADELFAMNIQMIILGTGDQKYHALLKKLEQNYSDKLKVFTKFDDALAHRIEAASDMFLMPSRWEPCGLNQLYSLKYGTVPVVRAVGGLADTVEDYDPETGSGTGFVFDDYKPEPMLESITRGVNLFSRKRSWSKVVKSGMTKDFSWEHSAAEYSRLFEQLATG
jgi:starch synthase